MRCGEKSLAGFAVPTKGEKLQYSSCTFSRQKREKESKRRWKERVEGERGVG